MRGTPMATNKSSTGGSKSDARGYRMISDAAKLMLRCAGYLSDREAENNGWRVFYAVDTDVISFYLAPNTNTEYATVFGQAEDADTRDLLSRLVSEFIFWDSRGANTGGNRNTQLF